MKYLTKEQWHRDPQVPDGINVVFMGKWGVGKTTLIRNLLRFNESAEECLPENIYEYREKPTPATLEEKMNIKSRVPVYRKKVIELGHIFIIVFAVDNKRSFEYATELKEEIFEMKGQNVPFVVVGNKSDRRQSNSEEVSYEFADLVVSVDWEKSYEEVSATENFGIDGLFCTVVKQQSLASCE